MTARVSALLVLALAANGGQARAFEPLLHGTDNSLRLFVSSEEIASGEWEALPIDDLCRGMIWARLKAKTHSASESEPVVRRVAPQPRAEAPISTLEALKTTTEVLVGRIVRVQPGMSCAPVQTARRIDIEVEEVVKGAYSAGDRIAVLEMGGWFDAQGVRFLDEESSFYPPAAVGDRTLVAGFGLNPGSLGAFTEMVRFRVQGDVIESAGAPALADREPQSLSRLTTILGSKK
jgi:hypothetical protein